MVSTATTRNRLEKQGTGENTGTWGTKLNTATIDLIDAALDGRTAFSLSGGKTLTSTNYAADESRMRFLDITGGTGGTVTIPSLEKWYLVRNAASGSVTFTTGSGTTATLAAGDSGLIACDASNVRAIGVSQAYVAQAILDAGLSSIPGLSAVMSNFLTVPTSANLAAAISDETGTGALVFASSPNLSSPVVTGGSFSAPTITGGSFSAPTITGGSFASASLTSPTVSGGTFANPAITGGTLSGNTDVQGSTRQNVVSVADSAIDCSLGNYFIKTASGALTWTFTNVPANRAYVAVLELTNGGTGAQTWPASVKWPMGIAPTLTASGVDLLGFITDDGGTTWRGAVLMADSK